MMESNNTDFMNAVKAIKLYSEAYKELKKLNIVRTSKMVGEYTEWFLSRKLGLTLSSANNERNDATDSNQNKYEIKSRWVYDVNTLGINETGQFILGSFDFLLIVYWDIDFNVIEAYKIPQDVVRVLAIAKSGKHILRVNNVVRQTDGVEDITELLK